MDMFKIITFCSRYGIILHNEGKKREQAINLCQASIDQHI